MKTFLSNLRFAQSELPIFSQGLCKCDANIGKGYLLKVGLRLDIYKFCARARRTRYILRGSGSGKINIINVHKLKISFSLTKDILGFIEKNFEAI